LLDGLSRVDDIVDRAIELGHEAIAITDHGNLFNAWKFYQTAKKKVSNLLLASKFIFVMISFKIEQIKYVNKIILRYLPKI
jgi:DNA polymerase III alpha subunit